MMRYTRPRVAKSQTAGIRLQMSKARPLLIVKARVAGSGPYNFVIDTGASLTILAPHLARKTHVRLSEAKGKAISATGHVPAQLARLDSLKIGTIELTDVDVAIMSLEAISRGVGLSLGGIIGYNVLKRFAVTIDYPHKRLYLETASGRKPARP